MEELVEAVEQRLLQQLLGAPHSSVAMVGQGPREAQTAWLDRLLVAAGAGLRTPIPALEGQVGA